MTNTASSDRHGYHTGSLSEQPGARTGAAEFSDSFLREEQAIAYALDQTEDEPETRIEEADALSSLSVLSPREVEVAKLIARGYTNRQIAQELVITEGTVGNHIVHIMRKLEFHSRHQITAWKFERDRRKAA